MLVLCNDGPRWRRSYVLDERTFSGPLDLDICARIVIVVHTRGFPEVKSGNDAWLESSLDSSNHYSKLRFAILLEHLINGPSFDS
jgi:hypothetical protein